MKKYLVILLIVLTNNVFCNSKDIDKKFNQIIKDLELIISKSEKKHPIVERNVKFILDKIKTNEISISFDTALAYSFRGCATANIIDSVKYNLSFGKYLLDVYNAFPYLVYGIIIHEFQHLHDFLTKKKLMEISKQNPIENTYFEIDALMLEALFLKTYAENKPNLSPVEQYLIYDVQHNLAGTATLFAKVDLSLLHRIGDIAFKGLSFEMAKNEYIKIGEELSNSVKFNDDAWNNYCNVITLKTYTFYSRQVLHDLLFKCSNISLTNEQLQLKDYPDINAVVKKIQDISRQHNESFAYYEDTMSKFEKYILNKIK